MLHLETNHQESDLSGNKCLKVSRSQIALDVVEIQQDLKRKCCSRKCTEESLNVEIVLRWRQKYHILAQGTQKQLKLLELYRDTFDGSNHSIEGILVCRKSWYQHVMKVSEKTYKRTKKLYKDGVHVLDRVRQTGKDKKGLIAKGFMTNFVSFYGEIHPESGNTLLPVGVTLLSIYKRYTDRYTNVEQVLQYAQFHKIWRTGFKHVKQQKISKMAKCDICTLAKEVLPEIENEADKKATRSDWEEHLDRQRQARVAYYARRDEGICNDDITSVIVDGMDQSKTDLPHFTQAPKCLDVANMLKTHLTGVLIHGKPTHIFVDSNQFPHDSNLTINCLFRALWNHGSRLGKKIYVQLDNCGRENKNRFLFATLALLIHFKKTKEVHINFLMVGHTHEDIDQRFSVISRSLRRTSAKTLPELRNTILNLGMDVTDVNYVYDVKSWLLPFMNDGLHNHSNAFSFRLLEDNSGNVVLNYKKWPTEGVWKPLPHEDKIELFKKEKHAQVFPIGHPLGVTPSWIKPPLSSVEETIQKIDCFFNDEQKEWWRVFFENPPQLTEPDWRWPLLLWEDANSDESIDINAEPQNVTLLSHAMQKERRLKKVYSGKRTLRNEVIISNELEMEPANVGHFIVYNDGNTLRFGEVIALTQTTLNVKLYRRVNDSLCEVKSRNDNYVFRDILKKTIREDLVFTLPVSKNIPKRIRLALN